MGASVSQDMTSNCHGDSQNRYLPALRQQMVPYSSYPRFHCRDLPRIARLALSSFLDQFSQPLDVLFIDLPVLGQELNERLGIAAE